MAHGNVLEPCWRSSTVEQLICNQQVVGSSPIASSRQINCHGGEIYGTAIARWKHGAWHSAVFSEKRRGSRVAKGSRL